MLPTKPQTTELPYYGFIAFIFIVSKLLYKNLGNDELLLFLTPVSFLVSFFTGSSLSFSAESGYYLPSLNILIDKSCSGFNFWLISFVMIGFTVVTYIQNRKRRVILLISSLLIAYLLTIIANTSRIISILKMNNILPNLDENYEWIHTAQGTFVYLFFLIGFYLLMLKLLRR
jgi:exosortase K